MRRSTCLLTLVLVLVSGAALAAEKERKNQGIGGSGFSLESEILARVPEVARAIEAVDAEPQSAIAWRDLGHALANRGAYVDAVASFQRSTKLNGDDPDVWVDMGAAQLRQGKSGAAKTSFQRALKIEPFHALAFYNLGLAHQADNNYEGALDNLERALLLDPTLGDPRINGQAANNELLPIVRHRVYLRTVGGNPALFTPGSRR